MDSATIHKLYLDGDFDPAIAMLENALKETRQYRHEDSVFIFKHLGVMYAAQYETREKGKYYMHKLLMVEPTAKIMDMYASDMIYMIFKNIQEEFEENRAVVAKPRKTADETDSMPARNHQQVADEASSRPRGSGEVQASGTKKWIWAGAAVATLAAGVGAYYLLTEQPPATVKEKDVRF